VEIQSDSGGFASIFLRHAKGNHSSGIGNMFQKEYARQIAVGAARQNSKGCSTHFPDFRVKIKTHPNSNV